MAFDPPVTEPFRGERPEPATAQQQTYRWDVARQRPVPVVVDNPPPPQQTVHRNHYVPVESDRFAAAYQWAAEEIARKYPRSVDTLTALDGLTRQKLNAS
ncbi:MAG: hypothetical protein ACRCT8_12025 [Lacipirellulaceae bacterium]